MQKVLIIGNDITKYTPLINSLSDNDTIVSACSYQDLTFYLDGDNTTVQCFSTGEDIREFSKVLILATSPCHLQNYIFSTLACYCRRHHISLFDDDFSNTDGKLYALWRFWEKDIPIAKTVFGPAIFMAQKLAEFGNTGVLKSVQGTKGRDNYLIHSTEELYKIVDDKPYFILQNYISNVGDWRIIVINFQPQLAIYRSSHGKDFRNNTSVGGDAKLVPLNEVDSKILELAVSAAKALNIKIAGADIMQDNQTGEYTVLEVNRTPQLATGAFTDAKTKILKDLISD